MELQDLAGNHMLSGVDECIVGVESVTQVRIILDENTYIIEEDDVDGYRSDMRPIKKDNRVKVSNTFEPIAVLCRHIERGAFYGEGDVLEVIDAENGKTILLFGLENIDDYYPGFICNWMPEHMAINAVEE